MNQHGFVLKYSSYIEEIKETASFFVHEKTGAEVVHIPSDDRNKVFAIAFSTIPMSDSGEAHVAEHAVLSGSEKYPLKELFSNLMKGSMATYLNAMTFPDKTVYPVASQNDKDFYNLVNVYLDSVFHPSIYHDELSFRQEGHGLIFDEEGNPSENGVVYSEMKGYEGSVDAALEDKACRLLFDNTYHYNSGGVPAEILKLRYEDFLSFHKTHYHPSNARCYLYGNADLDTYLELLDKEYFSGYEKGEKIAEPYEMTKHRIPQYATGNYQSTGDGCALELQFVLGDSDNLLRNLSATILASYIFGQDSSPFKKHMLSSGFCQDMYGHLDSHRTVSVLKITMHEVCENNPEKAEAHIFKELQTIDPVNLKKGLLASLNNLSFHLREGESGSEPKGMDYMYPLLLHFNFDNDPFHRLRYEPLLKKLQTIIENDDFEEWVSKYMLDNPFRACIVLSPSATHAEEIAQKEQETLQHKWQSLSEAEKKLEKQRFQELRKKQSTPDSEEAIQGLPKITIADIQKLKVRKDAVESAERFSLSFASPYSKTEDGEEGGANHTAESTHRFVHYELDSKIIYTRIMFPLVIEGGEDIALLSSATSVLGLLDTENANFEEINHSILMNSGGLSIDIDFYREQSYLVAEIRSYPDKLTENLKTLTDILLHSKFTDTNRVFNILQLVQQRMRSNITSSGLRYATETLLAGKNQENWAECHASGTSYYSWLNNQLAMPSEEKPTFVKKVAGRLQSAMTRQGIVITAVGSYSAKQELLKALPPFLAQFPKGEEKAFKKQSLHGVEKKAIITPAAVQFISLSGKLTDFKFNGHYHVFKTLLSNEYLWNELRVKSGAYGAHASIDRRGNFIFGTYRDPNCAKSIDLIRETSAYLEDLDIRQEELNTMIIGAISSIDHPFSPRRAGNQAIDRHFLGISAAQIEQERNDILATTPEDMKHCASMLKKAFENSGYVVMGSKQKIMEDKHIFDTIEEM